MENARSAIEMNGKKRDLRSAGLTNCAVRGPLQIAALADLRRLLLGLKNGYWVGGTPSGGSRCCPKWLLGWGTTFRELKVLSKMATGVVEHTPRG